MARQLKVEIVGDASSLNKALKKASQDTGKFSRGLGATMKGAGIAAAGIGAVVAVGLKKSIDSANEHAQALAQTQAVIKSTGGAANVTAKQITGLADSIEKKTGVDDVAIQKGENLLATFTNLRNETGKGNDIFTKTTKVMADMSTALGQDTKTSAIQLGKALNDPVKGITSLQKVGVSFTKGQKDQIKHLVASGKTMDAQKVILRELNKEFGGLAEAAGKTLPGQLNILKARLDDVAQRIGEKLVPALTSIVDWVTKHWPEISKVFDTVFTAIADAWTALQPTFKRIIKAIRQVIEYVQKHWPEISRVIGRVAEDIQIIWGKIGPTLIAVFKIATKAIVPLIKSIATVLKGVAEIIDGIIHGRWAEVWKGLKDVVAGILKGLKTLVVTSFKLLGTLLLSLILLPINKLIDQLNKIKIGPFDPIPHIPHVTIAGVGAAAQKTETHVNVYIDGKKTQPARVTATTQRRGRTAGLRVPSYPDAPAHGVA